MLDDACWTLHAVCARYMLHVTCYKVREALKAAGAEHDDEILYNLVDKAQRCRPLNQY